MSGYIAFAFFWSMLCLAVGALAERYNRLGIGWFLFAWVLSPLLAMIFLLALGKAEPDYGKIRITRER
jgi:hypothetical protein